MVVRLPFLYCSVFLGVFMISVSVKASLRRLSDEPRVTQYAASRTPNSAHSDRPTDRLARRPPVPQVPQNAPQWHALILSYIGNMAQSRVVVTTTTTTTTTTEGFALNKHRRLATSVRRLCRWTRGRRPAALDMDAQTFAACIQRRPDQRESRDVVGSRPRCLHSAAADCTNLRPTRSAEFMSSRRRSCIARAAAAQATFSRIFTSAENFNRKQPQLGDGWR
jgi:hypothetical protein